MSNLQILVGWGKNVSVMCEPNKIHCRTGLVKGPPVGSFWKCLLVVAAYAYPAYGFHSPWLRSANVYDSAVRCPTSKSSGDEADRSSSVFVIVLAQLRWVGKIGSRGTNMVALACSVRTVAQLPVFLEPRQTHM